MVRRSPWGVIAATLVATLVFGFFLPQQETASGNEGFSPDSPEFLALDVISEYFQDNSEEPVQVVVNATEGSDLLTAAGLRDYATAAMLGADPGSEIPGQLCEHARVP